MALAVEKFPPAGCGRMVSWYIGGWLALAEMEIDKIFPAAKAARAIVERRAGMVKLHSPAGRSHGRAE
jgi:hypothetical protein